MFERKIYLPRDSEQYDALVEKVVKRFKLKDKHHAAALISGAIRHIPNEEAQTTIKFLGHYVLKNLANYVAYHKAEELKHEASITNLVNEIEKDQFNQEAWDKLDKAAEEGSEAAKKALMKLEGKNPKLEVVQGDGVQSEG